MEKDFKHVSDPVMAKKDFSLPEVTVAFIQYLNLDVVDAQILEGHSFIKDFDGWALSTSVVRAKLNDGTRGHYWDSGA